MWMTVDFRFSNQPKIPTSQLRAPSDQGGR